MKHYPEIVHPPLLSTRHEGKESIKLTSNSFPGRRIINLQTTLSIIHSPLSSTATDTPSPVPDSHDRTPFTHPSLTSLAHLSSLTTATPGTSGARPLLTKKRLGNLASQLGMRDIVRWKPRLPADLDASGVDVVLTSTLYAIVGAVAMQQGGEVAGRVAKERILKPLGFI